MSAGEQEVQARVGAGGSLQLTVAAAAADRQQAGRHRSNAPNVSIKTAVSATAAAVINY